MQATWQPRQGETTVADANPTTATSGRFLLWVDGVGGYLVCLANPVTLGGPGRDADVPLMAGLSRRHATLRRSGESYLLEAHGDTRLGGVPVEGTAPLRHDDLLELGSHTRLRFRQPTALSATAVLEPPDGMLQLAPRGDRPLAAVSTINGLLLLDGVCLLGPGADCHLVEPETEERLVLFRRAGAFFAKSPAGVRIDGDPAPDGGPIPPGSVVTSSEFRFRLEEFG